MLYFQPMSLYEFLSLLVSIAGFVTVIVTIVFLFRQTREMTAQTAFVAESLKDSAYENARASMMTINEIFIEYPELRPYFYDGVDLTKDDTALEHRLAAVSEAMLDLFESILLHRKHFPQIWPAEEWDAYMLKIFACSPVFRRYLESVKDWYIQDLVQLMERSKTQLPVTASADHPRVREKRRRAENLKQV